MSRGQVGALAVIRDPAAAIAAGKCWLARWNQGRVSAMMGIATDSFHPRDCGWCEYPPGKLEGALTEFVKWAGISNLTETPVAMRAEIEMFLTLPNEEQKRLVEKAQGYGQEEDDDDV